MMGIGAYGTAPLWLGFLLAGIMLSLEARFVLPDYFPAGPSLFPRWPVVDPVRSKFVFILTMAVLLGPKLLAAVAGIVRERRAFGGSVRIVAGVVIETILAGLIAPVAMMTQSAAVLSILAGRDGGWNPQRREDGRVPLREVARRYWPHTLAGVALGLASGLVSVPLLLWMTPVVLGLGLAIPLAAWTAKRGPAAALRRAGLLSTPEERAPPPVLSAVAGLQAVYEMAEAAAVHRLQSEPRLLAAHLAMLPAPRRKGEPHDPALLLGRAKLGDADTLEQALAAFSKAELAAVLGEKQALETLLALTSERNS